MKPTKYLKINQNQLDLGYPENSIEDFRMRFLFYYYT